MKNFKLTIPEPCHESWAKMEPNEKGRFCDSCCKTVIDFTKKSNDEIKEYFLVNSANGICGHLKKTQLDSIVIQIPTETFQYDLSFQKLFLIAVLLTMGSMLFSCKTDSGKIQKIEKIEVIDTITKNVVDTLKIIEKDSLISKKPKHPKRIIEEVPDVIVDDSNYMRGGFEYKEVIDTITKNVVDTLKIIEKDSLISKKPEHSKRIIEEVPKVIVDDYNYMRRDLESEEVIEPDTLFNETKRKLNPIKEGLVFGMLKATKHPKFANSSSKNFEKDIKKFIIKGIEDENLIDGLKKDVSFQLKFKVNEKGEVKLIGFVGLDNDNVKKTFIKILNKIPTLDFNKHNSFSRNYSMPFTIKVE